MTLTQEQKTKLTELDNIIKIDFYKKGVALLGIKEKKLYLETHNSFESFCFDRYNFTKRKGDYLINASSVVDNFISYNESTTDLLEKIKVFPKAESQVRNLAKLPAAIQIKLWKRSVEVAQGKVPTAKIVNAIIDMFKRKDKKSIPDTEKRLPQIKLVPVTKPFFGQRIRVNSNDSLFAGIEGIITQIPNPDSAIVKLEDRDKSELIKIKDLATQTIVFPKKESKHNSLGIRVEYKPGYGCQHYLHVSKEVRDRIEKYATELKKNVNGTISFLLSNANLESLMTV